MSSGQWRFEGYPSVRDARTDFTPVPTVRELCVHCPGEPGLVRRGAFAVTGYG